MNCSKSNERCRALLQEGTSGKDLDRETEEIKDQEKYELEAA